VGVIAIAETQTGRGANWDASGSRRYSVELCVEVDSVAVGPLAVIQALNLSPAMTYRYPLTSTATESDAGSFIQSVSVGDLDEAGLTYLVKLEFGPFDAANQAGAAVDSEGRWVAQSWDAEPTLNWTSEDSEFAVTHDRDGEPILNKAGDPFDPPLTVPITTPVAVVSRIEKSFNSAWVNLYKNRVNASTWLGWAAESVLIKDITGERTRDPDWGVLWRVTYTFAFRPPVSVTTSGGDVVVHPGWAEQVLNAGLRQLVYRPPLTAPFLEPIVLAGAPASSPVPLDNDGKVLDPDGELVWLSFNTRLTADFDDLNMPSDLFSASTP